MSRQSSFVPVGSEMCRNALFSGSDVHYSILRLFKWLYLCAARIDHADSVLYKHTDLPRQHLFCDSSLSAVAELGAVLCFPVRSSRICNLGSGLLSTVNSLFTFILVFLTSLFNSLFTLGFLSPACFSCFLNGFLTELYGVLLGIFTKLRCIAHGTLHGLSVASVFRFLVNSHGGV